MSGVMKVLKFLWRLTMPGGVLVLLAAVLIRLDVFADPNSPAVRLFPYVFCGLGMVLSVIFNRSRVFFALLLLLLVQSTLQFIVPRFPSTRIHHTIIYAITLLLPLNLLILAWLKDRGIISPVGRRRLIILAVQIGAVALLCWPRMARIAAWLSWTFVSRRFSDWSRMPQLSLVAFLLATTLLVITLVRRYRGLDNSLLWTVIASFLAFRLGETNGYAAAYFAAAGMSLVVAVLESSYNMAYLDELTQLPSRRAFNQAALKLGDSYAIGMIDIDHFKKFNDTYGHEAGDQALRMVASRLAHVTGGGKAYRYGGEEFVVLFPGKQVDEAFMYLDRMRRFIEQSPFMVRGQDRRHRRKRWRKNKTQINVTVSIGLAETNGDRLTPAEVLRFADKALYKAKDKGRNCTVVARAGKPVQAVDMGARILSVK